MHEVAGLRNLGIVQPWELMPWITVTILNCLVGLIKVATSFCICHYCTRQDNTHQEACLIKGIDVCLVNTILLDYNDHGPKLSTN